MNYDAVLVIYVKMLNSVQYLYKFGIDASCCLVIIKCFASVAQIRINIIVSICIIFRDGIKHTSRQLFGKLRVDVSKGLQMCRWNSRLQAKKVNDHTETLPRRHHRNVSFAISYSILTPVFYF